ncbi:MAG: hypothetical protein M1835_000223 [Candelina submexicana]|nr:MAG: hypothetical protein M1835_000223 [Candelina submexicana]
MAPNPEQQAALDSHNKARARHGCPALQWDAFLTSEAEKWAQHLAQIGSMVHSDGDQRKGQGENLAWFWSSDQHAIPPLSKGVQDWLNEEAKYHGEKIGEGNFHDWGHYSEFLPSYLLVLVLGGCSSA